MIRLTKLTDYGIVLLTHMARGKTRTVFTARDLAVEARLPLPTVGRLLKMLTSDGLLCSHRGVHGGYSLARAADEITVAQIIRALEGPISLTECSDGPGVCRQEMYCPVKTNWQKINSAVHSALDGISLADMARPWSDGWAPPSFENPARTPVSRRA